MKRNLINLFVLLIILLASGSVYGQNVVVTDDDLYPVDASAMLDVKSDSKGLLIPRLTTAQRTGIGSPAAGFVVYDSELNVFYYYDGSGWVNISSSQVWDVNSNYVYLTSETNNVGIGTSTPNSKLEVQADVSFTADDTLFCVKDKNGNAVFAVFPDGVKVIVDEGAKGKVGGFAISGRSPVKAGVETDILIVTPDSTRIFVNDTLTAKGKVGGFAISGRSPVKGYSNDYLLITGDSTRMYVNDSTATKGKVGGFAISGRSPVKGITDDYLHVTRDSTRVYITESTVKGKVGGFAISGRSPVKAGLEKDYFNISANTTAEKIKNESRIMWYPEKSALLGGEVHVGSADSVGTNSTALGYRSISMGNWSQAFGYKSLAYGTYATAIGSEAEADTNSLAVGYQAKATGNDAFALGSGALAIADKSFAFGSVGVDSAGVVTGNTQAIGDYAYAFGLGSVSSGRGSFAMGANDTASGNFATAIGYKTKASNWYATSMGGYTKATDYYATAIGFRSEATNKAAFACGYYAKASGNNSIAIGQGTQATGPNAVAIGGATIAQGPYAFAANKSTTSIGFGASSFGESTSANGSYSIAFGYSTTSGGQYSLAGGFGSSTSGESSVAFGRDNTSSGDESFSSGELNVASGMYSVALGLENTASSFTCVSIGQFCDDPGGNATGWTTGDPLLIAGNGADGGPFPNLYTNALILYNNGNMTIAGALTQNSDERLKENIENLQDVLPRLLQIKPSYFEFRDKRSHPKGRHIGFIAQDIEPLFPELIEKDSNGYLSVEYANMTAVLLQAIKEQQELIEKQETKNNDLENQLSEMKVKLEKLEQMIMSK